ncbi:YceH family protein [Pantoea sp. 1.19]|uniref:YceH family protein n=1 Tax=Pantoea sp. 1.19 TaxID=1925589 RepID=UPI000948BE7B|nr:DUF480 domain-containing protein [Pantoea sp. 1.19]
MKTVLSALEARVIGALLEKQIATPEQYPLSLNAVVTACNQKSNRDPVMSLSDSEVQNTLDLLVKKHLVTALSTPGSRVMKYEQRLCNSTFGQLRLHPGEVAAIATLLLRGPQTPGEIRTRCQRLHDFADVAATEACLDRLASRDDGPLVQRLPREPGKRESRYRHLFSGDTAPAAGENAEPPFDSAEDPAALAARVASLEADMQVLKAQLASLLPAVSQDA